MKPAAANTTAPIDLWHSPIPYLFTSLALVLVIIAVALVLLLCSYHKCYSNSSSGNGRDQENQPAVLPKVLDPEPKVVVIMAGDDKPTYLATQATISSKPCCCEQV